MYQRFLYSAQAVGAGGRITLPYNETIEIQASVALPIIGGQGSARVDNFRYRNIFSFRSAESHVVGSYSANDKAYGTLAMCAVEGVNVLDVVTCDRLVARITTKHPDDGSEPTIIPLGSRFENLRIAGHPIEVNLELGLFCQLGTFGKLTEGYARDEGVKAQIRRLSLFERPDGGLPESRGIIGCSLAPAPEKLPPGLTPKGLAIYVPHFGTVYLAEFFITPTSRRLMMLRVELGCSVGGGVGAECAGGNGSGWP